MHTFLEGQRPTSPPAREVDAEATSAEGSGEGSSSSTEPLTRLARCARESDLSRKGRGGRWRYGRSACITRSTIWRRRLRRAGLLARSCLKIADKVAEFE